MFILKKGDPCIRGVDETISKWKRRKTAHFWLYKDFRSILKFRETLHCEICFPRVFWLRFPIIFCNTTTIWNLRRECGGVCCCIHWASWVLQEGAVGEASRGNWYSQDVPVHLGTVTGPGLALLRMCLEFRSWLKQTLKAQMKTWIVPRSSAQKWSLCLKRRRDGSWAGLWACC